MSHKSPSEHQAAHGDCSCPTRPCPQHGYLRSRGFNPPDEDLELPGYAAPLVNTATLVNTVTDKAIQAVSQAMKAAADMLTDDDHWPLSGDVPALGPPTQPWTIVTADPYQLTTTDHPSVHQDRPHVYTVKLTDGTVRVESMATLDQQPPSLKRVQALVSEALGHLDEVLGQQDHP